MKAHKNQKMISMLIVCTKQAYCALAHPPSHFGVSNQIPNVKFAACGKPHISGHTQVRGRHAPTQKYMLGQHEARHTQDAVQTNPVRPNHMKNRTIRKRNPTHEVVYIGYRHAPYKRDPDRASNPCKLSYPKWKHVICYLLLSSGWRSSHKAPMSTVILSPKYHFAKCA